MRFNASACECRDREPDGDDAHITKHCAILQCESKVVHSSFPLKRGRVFRQHLERLEPVSRHLSSSHGSGGGGGGGDDSVRT